MLDFAAIVALLAVCAGSIIVVRLLMIASGAYVPDDEAGVEDEDLA